MFDGDEEAPLYWVLSDFIKLITDEGLITEDLKGDGDDYIKMLKSKYQKEVNEQTKDVKQQKLFK